MKAYIITLEDNEDSVRAARVCKASHKKFENTLKKFFDLKQSTF